jgi:c-di-GMP phosphodiesterase
MSTVEADMPDFPEAEAPTPAEAPEAEPVGGDVVLLARQPILDTSHQIHGHELLFRREDGTGWPIDDENQATAHVLVAAFADMSLGSLTSGSRAWVNTPGSFLLDTDLSVLPTDSVVLEVLERDEIDAALYARVVELARAGYTLALDDFTWREDVIQLLDVVKYVKLDVRDLGLDGIAEHVKLLEPYDVTIVGEKVETADEVQALVAMGIGLFQGYYFEKPRLVKGRPAPAAEIARLRKATSLTSSATFEDVEQVVKLDPGISMRLLRYINSAAVSLRNPVSSLRQALMLVGANTVRQWLLLVLMGDLGGVRPAVLSAGLVRARLCETLAKDMNMREVDGAFIVGLLSVCDALLDTPLDEIIPSLPLSDEIKGAIVSREGGLGQLLDTAVALEKGEVGGADAKRAYALYSSVQWANAQLSEFASNN